MGVYGEKIYAAQMDRPTPYVWLLALLADANQSSRAVRGSSDRSDRFRKLMGARCRFTTDEPATAAAPGDDSKVPASAAQLLWRVYGKALPKSGGATSLNSVI